jgi:UDP-glucose 4-epimerase
MSESSRDWFNQQADSKVSARILVTGSRGFIGGYVVREIARQGMTPVGFDYPGYNVLDADQVRREMAQCAGFVHLAGILGTKETVDSPGAALQVNIMGMLNVLQAARGLGVPGANIAVGNWWMNNPYSISKNAAERLCHMFNKEHGTRVNTVRTLNAYGPGQEPPPPFGRSPYAKIVPTFTCNALTERPLTLYGGGSQISDMVFVEDVAKSLVTAMKLATAGAVASKTMSFGPSKHNTVRDVAEEIIRAAGGGTLVDAPMRAGEEEGAVVTADGKDADWFGELSRNLVPLQEGIARTVRWYADQRNVSWKDPRAAA